MGDLQKHDVDPTTVTETHVTYLMTIGTDENQTVVINSRDSCNNGLALLVTDTTMGKIW